MKRKIFSKLLMVALVIAAVGSFVSCKDYDDDINNLQKQIDAKAALSELTALQSTLDSKIAAAQSAAAAAQATANDAATKTALADAKAALEKAIEDAKKAGTDAGTKAGEAIAAANKAAQAAEDAAKAAKEADDAAKAELEAEIEKAKAAFIEALGKKADAAETADAIAAVKATAEAAYTKAEAEKLQEQVNNLKADLESTIEEKVKEAIKNVDKAVASVDAIWSAVTSVELIGTWDGWASVPGNARTARLQGLNIPFYAGKMVTDESFGNNEDKFFKFAEADQITYKTGNDLRTGRAIIVRVNPTNATFTKDQVKLIDSQGRDLSKIVEVGVPERYTGLITRATNTGLWVLPLKVVDETKKNDFNAVTFDGRTYNEDGSIKTDGDQILYAVAIQNDPATTDRYAASTFEIRASYNDYVAGSDFSFSLKDKEGNWFRGRDTYACPVKNRWANIWDTNAAASKWGIWGEDGANKEFGNPELCWAFPAVPAAIPAADNVTYAIPSNPRTTFADNRRGEDALEVSINKSFTFSLKDANNDQMVWYWNLNKAQNRYFTSNATEAEYYYVTLDLANAIESRPSEENAWKTYEIDGLNKMIKADSDLDITIKSPQAAGDFIGFRVYVVNYDGTLADPDGKAFYVHVEADEVNEYTVVAPITATRAGAAITSPTAKAPQNVGEVEVDASKFESLALNAATNAGTLTLVGDFYDAAADNVVTVNYVLLNSAGKAATNWTEIAKVRVAINHPEYILDGNTTENYISIVGRDQNNVANPIINQLNVCIKKVMPTVAPSNVAIQWRSTLGPADNNGVVKIYPRPYGWIKYGTPAAGGNSAQYNADNTHNVPVYWQEYSNPIITPGWAANYADWTPGSHTSALIGGGYTIVPASANPTTGVAYDGLYSFALDNTFRLANNVHAPTINDNLILFEFANANNYTAEGKKLYLPSITTADVYFDPFTGNNVMSGLPFNGVDMYETNQVTYSGGAADISNANIDRPSQVTTQMADYDMHIPASYIDNEEHASKAYYLYRGLSLTQDDYNNFYKSNYPVVLQEFKTKIIDLMSQFTFNSTSYEYTKMSTPTDGAATSTNKYIIDYENEATVLALYKINAMPAVDPATGKLSVEGYASNVAKGTFAESNLANLIADASTTIEAARASEILTLYGYPLASATAANQYMKYDPARLYNIEVSISDNLKTYYTLTNKTSTVLGAGAGNLQLTKIAGLTPEHDFDGTITITGYDIFGQKVKHVINVRLCKKLL